MQPDFRRAEELDELARQCAAEGDKAFADMFLLMAELERRGRPDEAMRVALPAVQRHARKLPPVTGFILIFTYRLTMLTRGLREAVNV